MNNHNWDDDSLHKQIEARLENGKPAANPLINALADSGAEADPGFQSALQERLIAHLLEHATPYEEPMYLYTHSPTPYAPSERESLSSLTTFAAAAFAVMLLGGLILTLAQSSNLTPAQNPAAVAEATEEPHHQVVIATRNIAPETEITDEMIGVIDLSAADFAELQASYPERQLITDPQELIGQTTTRAIFWFEPFRPETIGQFRTNCFSDPTCIPLPEDYYTITLPFPMISSMQGQWIVRGDHVDVLAAADGQMRVIVEDVLVTDFTETQLTLAAPSWKQAVLIWLYQEEQPYTVRLYTEGNPIPSTSAAELVEYTFTAPEVLPEDYQFDLIIGLSVSEGYKLVDLPYSIEETQYTQSGDSMQFWFKNIEQIGVDGLEVTVRIPEADAANLAALFEIGATMNFNPDAAATP